jgi:ribonuclease P protein component
VAFAIGRRVGGAVVRNRLRRRIRALFEAEARASGLPSGWYLVGVSPTTAEPTWPELHQAVAAIGQRLRVDAGSRC